MSQATDHALTDVARRERYRRLASKIREWMRDDSGYDERVGPLVNAELSGDSLRLRVTEEQDDR